MGRIDLTRANHKIFVQRINAVTPESKRKWGALEPAGMLTHLTIAIDGSLGDFPVDDKSTFFSRHIIRRIAFDSPMPLPKGKIKVPDEFTPAPQGSIEEIRARLLKGIERFIELAEREPNRKHVHPFFGQLPLSYWQKLHGKHMGHHFEQFGV